MAEVFPGNPLSAESLRSIDEGGHDGIGEALTLRMVSRSLVTYARTALIATVYPLYSPRDTSAKPPDSTSTVPSEQSGKRMDVGITRCRLHVLQSILSNLSRSRSNVVLFSRRCGSGQPSVGGGGGDVEELATFISLTRFWISGSVSRRNWKTEVILFPSSCRAVWYLGGFSYHWVSTISSV